jgi:hypothetical protein
VVVPVLDPVLVCAIIHALATNRIARICSKRFIVFSPYVIVPSRSSLPQAFNPVKIRDQRGIGWLQAARRRNAPALATCSKATGVDFNNRENTY